MRHRASSAIRVGLSACAATAVILAGSPAFAQDSTPAPTSSSSASTSPSGSGATSGSAPSSDAAATVPGAPTIANVTSPPAGHTLVLTVTPPVSTGDSPILRYEFSLNGESWMPCDEAALTCTITSLQNGITYFAVVRAVNAVGAGAPSAARSGIARFYDPAKPEKLPRPRTWVSASFNAASNGLGVDGARTRLGVGTLPQIRYSSDITDKKTVENHLRVTATLEDGRTRSVKGAWGWIDDRTVVFRPENYWPGHALVTITSALGRTVLGKSGAKYLVGRESLDTTYSFRTDRRMIIKVDGEKVRMKVFVDGVKKQTFPVSLGKSEWETRNGVKVIGSDKQPTHTYTSTSLGLDPTVEEPYELKDIPWNTRLTPSGEFIHSAPWAYSRIGRYNGSHGCTNMFESDAKWIFDKTIPGDVVIYENTGGEMVQSWNGPGGLWNIPWENWLKKSALGSASGAVVTSDTAGGPTSVAQDVSA